MTSNKNKSLTKDDVRSIVAEVVMDSSEAILAGIQDMFDQQDKKNNKRFTKIETNQFHIQKEIKEIKSEISDLPTRDEFSSLRAKVKLYSS